MASASLALLLMQVMDLVLPLLLVPIVVVLAHLTRPSRLNHLSLARGLVYTGACVLLTLLYAWYARLPARSDAHELRVVGVVLQAVPAAALGLWLLLAHSLAWHQRVVSGGLASLGLLVGMGHLLTLPQLVLPIVRLWMNGGPAPLASSRVQTLMGVGMMGALVIIVSYPFWLIALGRRLRARPRIGCTGYAAHPTAHE